MTRSIQRRAEFDAFFPHRYNRSLFCHQLLILSRKSERKYLESTRIRQYQSRPIHKRVNTSCPLYNIYSRTEIEVKCIRKHHSNRFQLSQILRVTQHFQKDSFNSRLGPYWHKYRCFDLFSIEYNSTCSCLSVPSFNGKL